MRSLFVAQAQLLLLYVTSYVAAWGLHWVRRSETSQRFSPAAGQAGAEGVAHCPQQQLAQTELRPGTN